MLFFHCIFSDALAYTLVQLSPSDVSVKDEQRSAIRAVYEGRDVFVCLPTGSYGKSLCYQTLPFVMDFKNNRNECAVVVVSPLTVLMEDQVCGLKKKKRREVEVCRLQSQSWRWTFQQKLPNLWIVFLGLKLY